MRRQRIKSRNGCTTCRRRHKKCDEARPICDACRRLQLSCQWRTPSCADSGIQACTTQPSSPPGGRQTLRPGTNRPSPTQSSSDGGDDSVVSDAKTSAHRQSSENDIVGFVKRASDTSSSAIAASDIHHAVISAVLRRDAHVADQRSIHAVWEKAVQFDTIFKQRGHGIVTRLAHGLLFASMNEYLRARELETPCDFSLPNWYVPSGVTYDEERIPIYVPWPAIRQKWFASPKKYTNNHFMDCFVRVGHRFIWPFDVATAVAQDRPNTKLSFSETFLLRVSNIRSFALSNDFLSLYPELRSYAPQFEPSVTIYRPRGERYIDAIFWQKVEQSASEHRSRLAFQGISWTGARHGVGDKDEDRKKPTASRVPSIRNLLI